MINVTLSKDDCVPSTIYQHIFTLYMHMYVSHIVRRMYESITAGKRNKYFVVMFPTYHAIVCV